MNEPVKIVNFPEGIEAVEELASSARRIASAITANVAPSHDESGGYISSLTEAVMGVTAGLFAISRALESVAEAIDNAGDKK